MYNALNPEQKAAWDKHYDPIIARFKKDKLDVYKRQGVSSLNGTPFQVQIGLRYGF